MEKNTTAQGGFWMLIEDLNDESDNEPLNAGKKEELRDGYDFYPDAGF